MNHLNKELSDSEIIGLLSDYNVNENDMAEHLKELRGMTHSNVVEYLENLYGDNTDKGHEEIVGQVKENDRRNLEEEKRAKIYKENLLKTIKAQREERRKKLTEEIKAASVDVPEMPQASSIKDEIKILGIVENRKEFIVGFKKDETMEDMYRKLERMVGDAKPASITVRRHGLAEILSRENEKIVDVIGIGNTALDIDINSSK